MAISAHAAAHRVTSRQAKMSLRDAGAVIWASLSSMASSRRRTGFSRALHCVRSHYVKRRGVCIPAPPGVFEPVERHRGEPGHTRDTRDTGKKTPGGAGTHTGHTGARGHTDHTDEPHNHPPKPKDTNPHENRDRLNSRKNSRKPGERSRPLPAADSEEAAPGEPDPASTRSQSASPDPAPARTSKAVGEMKARAADA